MMGFIDTGLAPGYQPNYRVTITDPLANTASYAQLYNDTDPRWTYTGAWSHVSNSNGNWQNDVHTTSTIGASASFTFTGTSVTPYVEKSPSGGTVTVAIDGTTVGSVSTTKSTTTGLGSLGYYGGLANGPHTLTLTLTSGTQFSLDAVVYAGAGYQVPLVANDTSSMFPTGRDLGLLIRSRFR